MADMEQKKPPSFGVLRNGEFKSFAENVVISELLKINQGVLGVYQRIIRSVF